MIPPETACFRRVRLQTDTTQIDNVAMVKMATRGRSRNSGMREYKNYKHLKKIVNCSFIQVDPLSISAFTFFVHDSFVFWVSYTACLFSIVNSLAPMDYDLRDLEVLFAGDPDDEDVQEVLLLKYIGKQQDLADAAALRLFLSFDFDSLPALSFHEKFHFMKEDIPLLSAALGTPHEFVARNRTKWSGLKGVCILLHRLSYSGRRVEAGEWFGRGEADISIIFNEMADFIFNRWS